MWILQKRSKKNGLSLLKKNAMLIALAKIAGHEGRIYSFSFYGHLQPYLPGKCVLLFVPGIAEQNKEAG